MEHLLKTDEIFYTGFAVELITLYNVQTYPQCVTYKIHVALPPYLPSSVVAAGCCIQAGVIQT